jgi:hypothetical protein
MGAMVAGSPAPEGFFSGGEKGLNEKGKAMFMARKAIRNRKSIL